MKIYKVTEASEYLGVSINTLKTIANNGKIKSFKTNEDMQKIVDANEKLVKELKDAKD